MFKRVKEIKMYKLILITSLFLFSSKVFSVSYTGKVEKIDLHGDSWGTYNPNDTGFLSLYISGMPKSCGEEDGYNRVVVTSDHPLFHSVISVALAAKLADKELTVHYLDTCVTRKRAWDFGYISFSG